ncbi:MULTISPECIES: DUF2188 domain-containing protein [Aerococcus]|uniref:DUF2188 domain-containing protein n=2 Tax=Aerococcus TaxID=1375 RepID=A0A1E9PFA9_9LACT|nr:MULTISPECIES: DUF2188 domain-containing protein [Aerococcus]KAA9239230.1 DUF2188 domain-containing protein [Aerococcus urinae]KAA9290772.1 DUF2188 domain-containing protein [Aerococcus mictus]KAA9298395.1 DUF2188 domain-containing protein [Aerococcus tenax]MCY3034133.1 DUF2188 domain-containing protein [Aerococcus mictus]MCY3063904.1 DUF2188 domain-containing protein [Aerococcus mictus]
MGKNQHVTPKGEKWQLIGAGNKRATKFFDTQAQAAKYGREVAKHQKSELLIHRKDGKIRSKDSYGNDPFPPKDYEN